MGQPAHAQLNLNSNTNSRYLQVSKIGHMLAVKIKKLNYFLFCRLEANLKKYRASLLKPDA